MEWPRAAGCLDAAGRLDVFPLGAAIIVFGGVGYFGSLVSCVFLFPSMARVGYFVSLVSGVCSPHPPSLFSKVGGVGNGCTI